MNTFSSTEHKVSFSNDLTNQKRQDSALREFKELLHELAVMLRRAAGTETVYLYWINRERKQFVMETYSTDVSKIVFQDRVGFTEHFLNEFKNIEQPVHLIVGKDIAAKALNHYYRDVPVRYLSLLPFINNGETVAITALEGKEKAFAANQQEVVHSYINILGKALNTYLEISDLHKSETEWITYEDSLQFLQKKGHYSGLLENMLSTIGALLPHGGASLIKCGRDHHLNVMNAVSSHKPATVGLQVQDRSLAHKVIKSKNPEFCIHFNQNPKRISPRESYTEGATLGVPLKFNDLCKAVVLAYDDNPLVFKESVKHKIKNIVRLTGLKIQSILADNKGNQPLFAYKYDAIIPDIWERVIDEQIQRLKHEDEIYYSWVGLVSVSGLSNIRTKFRLDDLELMQRDLVQILNPNRVDSSGFVGFYADYTYLIFIQSRDIHEVSHWKDKIIKKFDQKLNLSNGKQIKVGLTMNFMKLEAYCRNSYRLISELKKDL